MSEEKSILAEQVAIVRARRSGNGEIRKKTHEQIVAMVKEFDEVADLTVMNEVTFKSLLFIDGGEKHQRSIMLEPSNETANSLLIHSDSENPGQVKANWTLASLAAKIAPSIVDALGK
jgi:hypothetical protein